MPKYETANIRNVAFVGHGDCGKTSWAEHLLYKTGMTTRLGEVTNGTSVCDSDPDEKERKNSIDLAIVYAQSSDLVINILDAPGYPDFIGEAITALSAVDSAFLFINASAGIMINTRKMWEQITNNHLPCAIIVNKIDLENIKLTELFMALSETFGGNCLPCIIPNATGPSLKAVVNLIETTPDKLSDYPPETKGWREKLVEAVVEVDDQLLNNYLDGKEISPAELVGALRASIIKRKVVPIICASAKNPAGLDEIINFIKRYLPAPSDLAPREGVNPLQPEEVLSRKHDIAEPTSAYVFKVVSDPYVGKISYLHLFSGVIAPDTKLVNSRTQRTETMAKIFKPFAKELRPLDRAITGDLIAVTKIEDIQVGDTFCLPNNLIQYPAVKFPVPMVSLAIEPKSKGDEQRLSISLARLSDSDPTFKVVRDRQTNELVISGLSTLHLDIIMGRLKRRYDVQITTKPPKIPYKETIMTRTEGQYKHKKQTGGRGQYGEVYLRLEPLARGGGYEFANEIFGGAIPAQFVPAVEKGVKGVIERGVIAGYPIVDIKVVVFDGSFHVVDSSEAAFKIAASKAFQIAFKNGRPVLLEPIVNIEVTVPTRFMGDITGDLPSRRGRIIGMDTIAGQQVIKAIVPLAEIANYSTELRSLTGGEGYYSIEFSHYDIVPAKIQEAIVSQLRPVQEEEE